MHIIYLYTHDVIVQPTWSGDGVLKVPELWKHFQDSSRIWREFQNVWVDLAMIFNRKCPQTHRSVWVIAMLWFFAGLSGSQILEKEEKVQSYQWWRIRAAWTGHVSETYIQTGCELIFLWDNKPTLFCRLTAVSFAEVRCVMRCLFRQFFISPYISTQSKRSILYHWSQMYNKE